ncbi:MAG: 50S ribosomal protein L35 [Patescibacteria group bacterium]
MPKIKTHKATVKRFRYTAGKRLMRRKSGQDHFNARESGVTSKNKRRDLQTSGHFDRIIKRLTPYQ